MLKFFGISKKEKISVKDTANLFFVALNKVVNDGFPGINLTFYLSKPNFFAIHFNRIEEISSRLQ